VDRLRLLNTAEGAPGSSHQGAVGHSIGLQPIEDHEEGGHRTDVEVLSATTFRPRQRIYAVLRSMGRDGRELDFSLVKQLDGLAYATAGVRLERDVLALNDASSFTAEYGLMPFEACSSFFGFFHTNLSAMPEVVQVLSDTKLCGTFVVPVWPGRAPYIGKTATPWYDFLMSKAILVVDLPRDAFGRASVPFGVQAVVANFGYVGRLKAKRRPEKKWCLKSVHALRGATQSNPKVGPVPYMLTMIAPEATQHRPKRAQDTVKGCRPFPDASVSETPPQPAKSQYNLGVLKRWTRGYPYPGVKELALEVASSGVDPFVGDIAKHVPRRNGVISSAGVEKSRANWIEEAKAGRAWGPSKLPPFKAFRTCPVFDVPKAKYDPTDTRVRMISNFAKGADESVNSLCWSPRPLYVSLRPEHLRDRAAYYAAVHGPGVRVWTADKPSCFRWNVNAKRLLPLFVYKLDTEQFGSEYFVDLCNPFGCTFSEWGNQMVLAVERWNFARMGLTDVDTFVDNYFHFVPPNVHFESRCAAIEQTFKDLGIPLHERMLGTVFKGLGWLWDLELMLMICPEDKFTALCTLLEEWSALETMSLTDVRKAVGFMLWLSAGFEVGRGEIGHLVHMRTAGEAVLRRTGRRPQDIRVAMSEPARASLQFWNEVFPRWSRKSPIRLQFGPVASWEVLARIDASTDWGGGGIMVSRGAQSIPWFSCVWSPDVIAKAKRSRQRESTGFLEFRALTRWMEIFGEACSGKRVLIESDNSSVVYGIERAYSDKPDSMQEIVVFRKLCLRYRLVVRVRHIVGVVYNSVADALSHNRIDDARAKALEEYACPLARTASLYRC
jgi:hypothetical protein